MSSGVDSEDGSGISNGETRLRVNGTMNMELSSRSFSQNEDSFPVEKVRMGDSFCNGY